MTFKVEINPVELKSMIMQRIEKFEKSLGRNSHLGILVNCFWLEVHDFNWKLVVIFDGLPDFEPLNYKTALRSCPSFQETFPRKMKFQDTTNQRHKKTIKWQLWKGQQLGWDGSGMNGGAGGATLTRWLPDYVMWWF